jgi:hypothetical protein
VLAPGREVARQRGETSAHALRERNHQPRVPCALDERVHDLQGVLDRCRTPEGGHRDLAERTHLLACVVRAPCEVGDTPERVCRFREPPGPESRPVHQVPRIREAAFVAELLQLLQGALGKRFEVTHRDGDVGLGFERRQCEERAELESPITRIAGVSHRLLEARSRLRQPPGARERAPELQSHDAPFGRIDVDEIDGPSQELDRSTVVPEPECTLPA